MTKKLVHSCSFITSLQTFEVRHPVLRKGKPVETCQFEGDQDPASFHLGIFESEKLVAVASFLNCQNSNFKGVQMQLRGMAVLPQYRGRNYGASLYLAGLSILKERKVDLLWFNAREVAKDFYEKYNAQIFGEPFWIPEIGKHYLMYHTLTA
ncbi:MAG: GNAT family N-acetyltransferase [Flavobacteriaceae bacterium]|nr:GNAT family N-acetyltransferase [Flavobacteriaceae bacterium]